FEPVFLEKHFTTDKTLPGRDNQFAIVPEELAALRRAVETRAAAMKAHGEDFLPVEEAARIHYSGRFDKKES
ncbi:MAG: N-acetylneuraminate synthase family protein, partial [Puniceicoccales bacterium]